MKVSVIIPVYNAEAYLHESIDSVLGQKHRNVELILVDDGSTDSSAAICDKTASTDGRVKVVHQPNSGQAAARNRGLDEATGDYVAFVDADDRLHPSAIGLMLRYANGHDIVMSRFVYGTRCRWTSMSTDDVRRYTQREALKSMLYQQPQGVDNSACGKLFAMRLFETVRFTEGLWYEDLDIMYRLVEAADGHVIDLGVPLYFYRTNPTSFIHTFNHKRLDVLKVVDKMEEHYAGDAELLRAARDRKFSANCNMYILCSQAGMHAQAAQCWRVIRGNRSAEIADKNVRVKNKLGALLSYLGPRAFRLVAKAMS